MDSICIQYKSCNDSYLKKEILKCINTIYIFYLHKIVQMIYNFFMLKNIFSITSILFVSLFIVKIF